MNAQQRESLRKSVCRKVWFPIQILSSTTIGCLVLALIAATIFGLDRSGEHMQQADPSADSASREEVLKNELNKLNDQILKLYQEGKGRDALPVAEKYLEFSEKAFGPMHPAMAISLNNVAWLYDSLGDYSRAEPLYKRAVQIQELVLGPEDPNTAVSLNNLAELYRAKGDYKNSEPLHQRALRIQEKVLGKEHPTLATSLNNLGLLYCDVGNYAKAEAMHLRALEIREKALGPVHPDCAASLIALGVTYSYTAAYARAEPLYRRALAIQEKAYGAGSFRLGNGLNSLAALYYQKGDYAQAEPLYQRALKIRQAAYGPEHPEVAMTENNLAELYRRLGDYEKSEALHLRALKTREKVLRPDHPDTAISLNNLGGLYESMGAYVKAEPVYERALEIGEKVLGLEHPNVAATLNNLGVLNFRLAHYTNALAFHERSLKIREKILGTNHPSTAASLKNLADVYNTIGGRTKAKTLYQQVLKIEEAVFGSTNSVSADILGDLARLYVEGGDYAQAELLLQKARKMKTEKLGEEHPETSTTLYNLAELYRRSGDYAKAEPLYRRAIEIRQKALGLKNPRTAAALVGLALLYDYLGDYDKAGELHQQALNIQETLLGAWHPETGISLVNLGAIAYRNHDNIKAKQLYERALAIQERSLGREHPATAATLNNLAEVFGATGEYAEAASRREESLRIRERVLGPDHPDTALSLNNLGALYFQRADYSKADQFLQRALKIRQKIFGEGHPDICENLENAALVLLGLDRKEEAQALARRSFEARHKMLANVLSFASEDQRLAFQRKSDPLFLLASVGDINSVAAAILRFKGVVLDSLMEDRLLAETSESPEQRALIDQVNSAKPQLSHLIFKAPGNLTGEALAEEKSEREHLSRLIEDGEGRLARQVAGLGKTRRALSVKAGEIQTILPPNGVLIEWVRYLHYLGANTAELRYGALVLARSTEAKWLPLGGAVALERTISLYQKSVRGETDETTLKRVLKNLYQQVWQPIEAALPEGARTIILSPDGQLNFVSFATLLNASDEFLAEKYGFRYVASGRDLTEQRANSNREMLIYGNPDYRGDGSTTTNAPLLLVTRSLREQDFEHWQFEPLTGTEREARELSGQAKQWNLTASVSLVNQATEAKLKSLRSPYILHLATHGFFLPETDSFANRTLRPGEPMDFLHPKVKLKNPMHRSGLALAGAQRTLEAWKRGEAPPPDNDGILTAEEVSGLKLRGTWLVTLSACDTGTGEARAGEGVLGLRRGFLQAGAQNLLMTLWPVADQETVDFMMEFYETALKTGDPGRALAEAQREWLVKLRKERGLLDAVRLAGPFILSSQGPIK
jgi:tetratricopeptide (TPR) repeat protein/CHAT domain-containing protein